MKSRSKSDQNSIRIAGLFLSAGVLLLIISILYNLQIMAFIGLGFTFWGAIFTLSRKGNYIESSLLDSSAKTEYSTIERVINELKYTPVGYYIPAYPKDTYIPDYLEKLKEPAVFISDEKSALPAVDELVAGKFLSEKSDGIFITSPGAGLMDQMEKTVNQDFSKVSINELCGILPRCMTELFNLAKHVEMEILENGVSLRASGILYESLYRSNKNLKTISIIGCPLVSATASALAKASGKTVKIQRQICKPNNLGVEVLFNFL